MKQIREKFPAIPRWLLLLVLAFPFVMGSAYVLTWTSASVDVGHPIYQRQPPPTQMSLRTSSVFWVTQLLAISSALFLPAALILPALAFNLKVKYRLSFALANLLAWGGFALFFQQFPYIKFWLMTS